MSTQEVPMTGLVGLTLIAITVAPLSSQPVKRTADSKTGNFSQIYRVDNAPDIRIRPYTANPFYWQYRGKPVMLLGGSDDDALFQWAGNIDQLRRQLDLMQRCGGNYIRCNLSARNADTLESPPRVGPYRQLKDGRYDLYQWNEEYWRRLRTLLEECQKRDIIAQIEVWATYDLINPQREESWPSHPLNPKNNVNYDYAPDTLFPEKKDATKNDLFYETIPTLKHDPKVLKAQQAFVNKVIDESLAYGNILYCVDNELRPHLPYQWSHYWADYMHDRARQAGKIIYVSEMHRDFETPKNTSLSRTQRMVGGKLAAVFDYPQIHPYLELSETSTRYFDYDELWKNIEVIRAYVADHPRPMNHVKVYGGGDDLRRFRKRPEAIHRFCMFVCGGRAAVRFHRPVRRGENGMGLNVAAQACLRAVRQFCDDIKPWECQPHNDLLGQRDANEAYLMAQPERAYGLLFTGIGGDGLVELNLVDASGRYLLRWINLESGQWGTSEALAGKERLTLRMPSEGSRFGWLATLVRVTATQ